MNIDKTNITNISLHEFTKALFGSLLQDDEITEIAINKPGEIWFEKSGTWHKEYQQTITLKLLKMFSVALASFNSTSIDDINPIVSGTLETGERVQIVMPPAGKKDTISVTLRKPSKHIFPHSLYIENGFYDHLPNSIDKHKLPLLLEDSVRLGKTIIFAGATGSGKTSFMKTLIEYIPLSCRLITIEDVEEIKFFKHENYYQLFFPSESTNDPNAVVTPSSLLKSCFRMKPDRILLSEIRGGEAWDFLKIISSGHGGSMTSIHAGSVSEAIDGIVTRCFQNPECNLSYQLIKDMVLSTVDIICHITCKQNKRYLNDIYFKDVDLNSLIK